MSTILKSSLFVWVVFLFIQQHGASDLAQTPPMGWNSWNSLVCDDLTADHIRTTARLLVDTGLREAGYVYLNLDDCWQLTRNRTGHIQPDPSRFPGGSDGMRALGDYIHSLDLKFGIYTDMGALTCQRRPGSFRHEVLDAQMYASWNVDFVKNDDCFTHPAVPISDSYKVMAQALRDTGRPIVHSVKGTLSIERAVDLVHMRRVGVDIGDDWPLVMHLVDVYVQDKLWLHNRIGFWNDLDMLEIGHDGLTQDEQVVHMALWCAFKAPLLMGNRLDTMSNDTLKLLKHKGFLQINQDPLGKAAYFVQALSATSDSGTAATRVVSNTLAESSDEQVWMYDLDTKQLVHKQTHQCLAVESNKYLLVKRCENQDNNQMWSLDKNQIHPASDSSQCITMSREALGEAKLRPCAERASHLDWQGPVQSYMGFQESFQFLREPDGGYLFRNKNHLYLSVGGRAELLFFAGELSNDRSLVVIVNSDTREHEIQVDYSLFPGLLETKQQYDVIDVYTDEMIQSTTTGFSASIKGHYVLVAKLSKV